VAEFSAATRAAIYEAGGGRCVGCGRADVTAQHRRRRGMGGSRDPLISTPANGVPLCGSGTTGCHGWTERHPLEAKLLGWALGVEEDQLEAPFWTRFGWRRWVVDVHRFRSGDARVVHEAEVYLVAYVDDDQLDWRAAREQSVAVYRDRADGWR
jgi:hypothetical protein